MHGITSSRKLLITGLLAVFFLFCWAIAQVYAATNDSSISMKKNPATGIFTMIVKDPDGIQKFSLSPVGKLPYGGELTGCKTSFTNNSAVFEEPNDFTPVMPAYVLDCANNRTELEIPLPVDGVTKSHSLKKEEPPPPPPPPPKTEKKEGPLSAEDIEYPVPELGNCQNDVECRSYCDISLHAKECFAFAKKYNLISEEEAKDAADKFLNIKNGPGGCNSGTSCEEYCSIVEHLDQCVAFAEETGYYSGDELAEVKKIQELVKSGREFPGNCKDRNSCELYCSESSHMEECLNFAEATGFMPKEEIAEARKFMNLMQSGESPGGCTSKEQCESYCSEDGHIEECIVFAEKAGVMTAEEAQMARKVGGKGPGGCKGKAQCETYCEANSEECFNWAKEHGLISEDDLKQMSEGMARFREELDKMPPEAVACMKEAIGEENFNKMLAGEPVFDRSIEDKTKSCFGQITAQFSQDLDKLPPEAAACIKDAVGEDGFQKLKSGELDKDFNFESIEACFKDLQSSFGGGSNFSANGFSGPGGCKNTEECTVYCQEHPQECQGFGPPSGGDGGGAGSSGFSGPGGCTNKEECQAYCQAHPDECKNFAPPGGNDGRYQQQGQQQQQSVLPPTSPSSSSQPPNDGVNYSTVIYPPSSPYHPSHLPVLPDSGEYAFKVPTKPQSCVADSFGLVSWWDGYVVDPGFQSKQTALDIHGGNNGLMPYASYAPGKVGQAFVFNGKNTYGSSIVAGNPANLNFDTGPFSLEAWFKWESGGESSVNNIIRKSLTAHELNRTTGSYRSYGTGYWLRINQSTKQLEFFTGDTSDDPAKPRGLIETPVSAGIWYHVIATRNSSGTMKLYVDGELKDVKEAPDANTTSESSFTIGAWKNDVERGAGVSESFMGLIDEVAVYNKALSASEVASIFNLSSEGKCSRQVAYPATSVEYKRAYVAQQEAYQSYLIQKNGLPPGTSDFALGPGGCEIGEGCEIYCAQHDTDPACHTSFYLNEQSTYQFVKRAREQTAERDRANQLLQQQSEDRTNAGCTSGYEYECKTYCAEHPSDYTCQQYVARCAEGYDYTVCQQSTPPPTAPIPTSSGESTTPPPAGSGGFVGPGGCTNPEECQAYCTAHYMTDPACQQPAPSSPSSSLTLENSLAAVLSALLGLFR